MTNGRSLADPAKPSWLAARLGECLWPRRLKRYPAPELFILDAFASTERNALPQRESLFALVSRRSRKGSLIVTVQLEPQDSFPLPPNPLVPEALPDRLPNSAHSLTMQRKSYQERQRPRASEGSALLRESVVAGRLSRSHI